MEAIRGGGKSMIDYGKRNVLGIMVSAVDYEAVVSRTVAAAAARRPLSLTALAVHGIMTGVMDAEHKHRLNAFDLVVPDGQPVRWALNLLHGCRLKDRVYGPNLTLKLCERAAREQVPVYFYGSTPEVIGRLRKNLPERFPGLRLAGLEPSRFRQLSVQEKDELVRRIRESGAGILFVGLGCPRQEVFAFEMRDELSIPIVSIGAAFPFHAGTLAQAPGWMQARGLEWLFRLASEPKRLWRRYLLLNPAYAALVTLQVLGRNFRPEGVRPKQQLLYG
jgi:exopolysaccharide biosynthesis WecB/TagA/CpsF family protein